MTSVVEDTLACPRLLSFLVEENNALKENWGRVLPPCGDEGGEYSSPLVSESNPGGPYILVGE